MQCDFRASIECLAENGVHQTAVWIEKLDEIGLREAVQVLQGCDVKVNALCPGGFFTGVHSASPRETLDRNQRWLDQAVAIGADSLVVITGGLREGERDLLTARERALEGTRMLLGPARDAGIKLALEPLHPMVCGLRSVISTVSEALDMLDDLNADDVMGLAIDTYAVWWDNDLPNQLERAGSRLLHLHVSDWLVDTQDVRLDRGMPGDGLIPNRRIRSWMEKVGFKGAVEVEIFSGKDWWQRDADEVVKTIIARKDDYL